jgi:CheY-like chemotaxis protein
LSPGSIALVGASGVLAGVCVLVVEDHDDLLDALRHFLEQAGAEVETAANGLEALEVLGTKSAPDVIVSDVQMPHMDGCELVLQVRKSAQFGRIPVIALTGQTSEAAMLRTLEAGFDAYLVKPVSGDALTAQVLRVLGKR